MVDGCRVDICFFFFSSRRRHTRLVSDWSSDVCSSDLLLCKHDDAAAFGRFVGDRGELRGFGKAFAWNTWRRQKLAGHAVAERDRAGLVEEEHVDVPGGLDRAAGH